MVSPYSWSYPGGVTAHIAGLTECLIAKGHEVTVLSPVDPPDRLAARLHRGARPQEVPLPAYVVPLGRTIGVRANGSVSSLSLSPHGVARLHRQLTVGAFDVVHVHEPDAPAFGWAAVDWTPLPLVGTFHTYNEHPFSHGLATLAGARRMLNRLHVRIAVSPAAAWTAQRYFGGDYRVIPNGVSLGPEPTFSELAALSTTESESDPLRVVFVGQPVARKGLPVLAQAFETLRQSVGATLTIIGPSPAEVPAALAGADGVLVLGKVDDERKRSELRRADVLCAPSLGGESFGTVLVEALAAGTPVVASDIPGYRSVIEQGVDGLLVPPGDAQALAMTLYDLWSDPPRREALARRARASAQRFEWPQVADEVVKAYEDARAVPEPTGTLRRAAVRVGVLPADLRPRMPARRLQSLQPRATLQPREPVPPPARPSGRRTTTARRLGSLVALLAVAVLCWLALRKIGLHNVETDLSRTDVGWVVLGLGLMSVAMVLRAVSWYASLKAALPRAGVRLADAMRGLFIGVLVSSTLPANLGEPSRALVVARRTGRPKENLSTVAGTLVSQSLLNVVAVTALTVITLASVGFGSGAWAGLVTAGGAAIGVTVLVLGVPPLLRRARPGSWLYRAHTVAGQVRLGLTVFRQPRLALTAVSAQLSAWGLQWLAVYTLLVAVHLQHPDGLIAAAAVLCVVNVTMLLPVTPGDVGVFQAAVAAVLHTGWHVPYGAGVAFGVILQACELVTALVMGAPALVAESVQGRRQRLWRP